MAKKDSNDLDGINLDSFDGLDGMDELDAMMDPSKDTRTPTTKVKDSFVSSFKDTVKTPSYIKGLMRKALPEEYESAFDAIDKISDRSEQLYNKSADQLEPTLKEIRKKAKNLSGTADKFLPKKWADALKDWANSDSDYKYLSEDEQRKSEMALEMANVFKTNAVIQNEQYKATVKRDAINQALDFKKHGQSMDVLSKINRGIRRLVGYQDNVTAKYQQKSLELQYRSLFLQQDAIKLHREDNVRIVKQLEAIVTNTGLPDAIKLTKTEAFKTRMRDKFVDKVQGKVFKGANGIIDRVFDNAGDVLERKINDVSYAAREIMGVHDMLDMGMGMDGYGLAGMMGGSLAADFAQDSLGSLLKGRLEKNGKVKGFGLKIASMLANATGSVNKWANSRTDIDYDSYKSRMKGWGIQGAKDLFKGGSGYKLSTKDLSEGMDEATSFTHRDSKALSEIIPGFLSRILREVTVANSGDKNTPFVHYNLTRGKFTTYSAKRDDITKRLISKKGNNSIGNDLRYFIKFLDKDNSLSDSAQKAFMRQMLINSKDGHSSVGFDIKELSKAGSYDVSINKEDREELAKHFVTAYKGGELGGIEDNIELKERILQATNRFNNIGRNIPDLIDEMELQLKLGNLDVLEEMGLMEEGSDGKLHLNHDKLIDFLMGEDDASKTFGRGPTSSQSTLHFAGYSKRGYRRSDIFGRNKRGGKSDIRSSIIAAASDAIDTLSNKEKRQVAIDKARTLINNTYDNSKNFVFNKDYRQTAIDNTRNIVRSHVNNAKTNITNVTNNFITQLLDDDTRYQLWLAKNAIQEKYGQSVDISKEWIEEVRTKAAEFAKEHGLDEELRNQKELLRYHSWFLQKELEDRFDIKIPSTQEASEAITLVMAGVKKSTTETIEALKTSDGRKLLTKKGKVRARMAKRHGKRLLNRAKDIKLEDAKDKVDSFIKEHGGKSLDDHKQSLMSGIESSKKDLESYISDNSLIQTFRMKAETFIRETGLDKIIKTPEEREAVIEDFIKAEIAKDPDSLAHGVKHRSRVSKKRRKAQAKLAARNSAQSIIDNMVGNISAIDPKFKFAGRTTINIVKDKNGNSWQQVESNGSGNLNQAITAIGKSESRSSDSTTSGTDYSEYATAEKFRPAVIERLDSLVENIKASTEILKAGLIVQTEKDADGNSKKFGFRYGLRGGLGKALFGAGSLAKATMVSYGRIIKGWGSFAGSGLKSAGHMLLGVSKSLGRSIGIGGYKDIYVYGEDAPRLLARKLKKGLYKDGPTGKTIKSLKDLDDCKGPIMEDGNEVISVTDVTKGCWTKDGEPVLKKWTRRAFDMYSAVFFSPLGAAGKAAAWVGRKILDKLTKPQDVYVKGDVAPRMLANIMTNGGYFSGKTGKVIRKVEDIDGEVKDREGNIVLSLSDLAPPKGIVDKHGKPFSSLSEKLASFATKVISGTVKAAWATAKFGARMAMLPVHLGNKLLKKGWKLPKWGTGMNEADKLKVKVEAEMLTTLQNIYHLLDKRIPAKKRLLGDTNGDGIREGSAEDIRRKRATSNPYLRNKKGKDEAKAKDSKKESKEDKEDGILSKLGSLLMMIPGIGTLGSIAGKAGGLLKSGAGLLARGASGLATKVAPMALNAGRVGFTSLRAGMLATSIAGGAGFATGGLLGGTAAILASPLVLGALAVGAVAGVGYLGYKYYKNRNKSLFKQLRMQYYGLKQSSDDEGKAAWLEDYLYDHITYSGNQASIDVDEKMAGEILEHFDIKSTDEAKIQTFMEWFDKRFKPVYLDNCAALQSCAPGSKLDDLDSKLTKEQKAQVLNKVKRDLTNDPIFQSMESPFAEPLSTDSKMVENIIKELEGKTSKNGKVPSVSEKFNNTIGYTAAVTTYNKDGSITKTSRSATGVIATASATTLSNVSGSASETQKVSSTVAKPVKSRDIDPLDCVRFKTYGLVEMDKDKVKALQELEHFIKDDITYDKDNKASYDKSADFVLDNMAGAFGVPPTDTEGRYNWTTWFSNRFLVTYLNFASAVKTESRFATLDDVVRYLKPNQVVNVANLIVATTIGSWLFKSSVWSLPHSPWSGYELNSDSSSTKGNIKLLESRSKSQQLQDMTDLANSDWMSTTTTPKDGSDKKGSGILSNIFGQTNDTSGGLTTSTNNNPVKIDSTPELIKRTITEGSKTSAYGNKDYIMPSDGRITSKFGMRTDPIYHTQKMHSGIDIGAPSGTPVRATADGTIIRREWAGDYGNLIIIKHNDGRSSRYGHMLKFQSGLDVGSSVKQGDIIGYVGSTGKSTGPHLHFEIREGSNSTAKAIDPIGVLDKAASAAPLKELADTEKTAKEGFPNVDLSMEGKDTIASTIAKVATPSLSINPTASAANTGLGDNSSIATTATTKAAAAAEINTRTINERNRMVNDDNNSSLSSTLDVLKSSYRVQVNIDQKLGDIKDLLVSKASAVNNTNTSKETPSAQVIQGNRPTRSNVVNNPVSVKKTQY